VPQGPFSRGVESVVQGARAGAPAVSLFLFPICISVRMGNQNDIVFCLSTGLSERATTFTWVPRAR
jgi:hypothetical protein